MPKKQVKVKQETQQEKPKRKYNYTAEQFNDDEKPEGYVFGRPTKYKPEYCQQLIEHMREGQSFWTFAAKIETSWEALSNWCEKHPDFREAKVIGRVLEMQWWDNLHRRCAATGDGNATMIVWAQKNKFPRFYKERLAKGQQQIQLNANLDVKQLIAQMKPEELSSIVAAIEAKTLELEAASENTTDKTK